MENLPLISSEGAWKCVFNDCGRQFTLKRNAIRHAKSHFEPSFNCLKCPRKFRRSDKRDNHSSSCMGYTVQKIHHPCLTCGINFRDATDLKRHLSRAVHKKKANTIEIVHTGVSSKGVRKQIPEFTNELWSPIYPEDSSQALKNEYDRKWGQMRTQVQRGRIYQHYNLRLGHITDFDAAVRKIFEIQDGVPFKVCMEGGFMLEKETQSEDPITGVRTPQFEYQYFYPEKNTRIVNMEVVFDEQSLEDILQKFWDNMDMERIMKVSPDSRWTFYDLVNVMVRVYPLRKYKMIGMIADEAQDEEEEEEDRDSPIITRYLLNSKSIRTFRGQTRGSPQWDRLCVFRAIADKMVQDGITQDSRESVTKQLAVKWIRHAGMDYTVNNFPGVRVEQLREVEKSLGVRLNIFQLFLSGQEQGPENDDFTQDEAQLADEIAQHENPEQNIADLLEDAAEQGFISRDQNDSDFTEDDVVHSSSSDENSYEWDRIGLADAQPSTFLNLRSESSLDDDIFGIERGYDSCSEESSVIDPQQERQMPDVYGIALGDDVQNLADLEQPAQRPSSPASSIVSNATNYIQQPVEAKLIRRTVQTEGLVVNVVLHDGHFYRITKLQSLCKSWRCQRCSKYFNKHCNWMRHQGTCDRKIKRRYPAGGFTVKPGVFERIRKLGHHIEDQFYDSWIVFDFEARFEKFENDLNASKLRRLSKLIPVSVSVVTNFDGEDANGRRYNAEPKFMYGEDPKKLIEDFYAHIQEISRQVGTRKEEELKDALDFLKSGMLEYKQFMVELKEIDDEDAKRVIRNKLALVREKALTYQMLLKWTRQVPVIGFNSGKFDLNLVREHLLPVMLHYPGDKVTSVIERGSDFMSITTVRLQFLDMVHYLPPGFSLDDFIKCYNPMEGQGKYVWCYEFIDGFEKLFLGFPSREAFRSTLKNRDITEAQYQQTWQLYKDHHCRHLLDLLKIYNNQDVIPFLAAIQNMFGLFKDLGIDMFKMGCISLPGVAMRRMFSQQGTTIIPLFSEKYKYWHKTIKENVVGGPAIVFKRFMHLGDRIRNTENECMKIMGYDANSLYLYCTGLPMPVGIPMAFDPEEEDAGVKVPVHERDGISKEDCLSRIEENMGMKFKRHVAYNSKNEIPWVLGEYNRLKHELDRPDLTIQHAYNGGQAMFLSQDEKHRIYVDGYIPEIQTVLEFNGCWYHGHQCRYARSRIARSEDPNAAMEEWTKKYRWTEMRRRELERHGLNVRQTWECQYMEMRGAEKKWSNDAYAEVTPLPSKEGAYTASDILEGVRNLDKGVLGEMELFGLVECDLQVPWWNSDLRQKMAELPPIFKNTVISREDIGEYMAEYAQEANIFNQPRRSLISSYHATKICLITPLLKYLMELGVVVTRLYKAIYYRQKRVFKFVADEVTEARRAADDASTDRIAVAKSNVAKLIGNSCYGKCLTNVEKHEDVKLMTAAEAENAVNNPLFVKLDQVDDEHYLVHFAKGKVTHDLPIIIAFFVYGYAKMRMLQFYYNFLMRHLGPEKFELIQMDTDSLYFACSEFSLDEAAVDSPDYATEKPKFIETPETRRQPGLFKLEWEGEAMIALNPKCYYGRCVGGKDKISMKGVSHTTNSLTYEQYVNILQRKQIQGKEVQVTAVNKGFRKFSGHLEQYELRKNALSHLYIKRRVLADMKSTEPLDL